MPSMTPEAEEIMEIERAGCRFVQAGDIDAVIAGCAEDFLQFSPGAALSVGRENFRKELETVINTEGYGLSWEPTFARVSESQDMAYVYGTLIVITPDGEQPGKYVAIYEKRDGPWHAVIDIPNSDV